MSPVDDEIVTLERILKVGVVSIVGILAAVQILGMWLDYRQNRATERIVSDVAEILAIVDGDLVDGWTLEAVSDVYRVDAGSGMFVGDFDCSDEAVEVDALIQFSSSLIGETGTPSLIRPTQVPRLASEVCDFGRVEFFVDWSILEPQIDGLDGPVEYRLVTSAEADGFTKARASTEPFLFIP